MNLKKLRSRRQRRRNSRAKQYRKWKRTGRTGHLRAFQRHDDAVKKLNDLIERELKARRVAHVIPREAWGAQEPRGSYQWQSHLKAGVQHHTAMPTLSPKATVAEEKARMRQIQAGHLGQGWADIGYALVCFPSGRIYEGRPKEFIGAHTLNHNTGYAGWSLDGNYETSKPSPEALKACHRCRELLGVAGKPIYGHRDLNPTACPGRNLYPHLGKEI